MSSPIAYDQPGPLTTIAPDLLEHVAQLPDDPIKLCRAARRLLILPEMATAVGVADERLEEKSIRDVSAILRTAFDLDAAPIHAKRSPEHCVVGTCRHFSVLSCAFLRFRGYAARSRCGFATYFQPDLYLDHWITEYWHADEERWVRVDSEILGFPFVAKPEDLAVGEFLTGGESWRLCQEGADPSRFGVPGFDYTWGIAEVRGNAIRDLAALCKVEMLPWDEWGRMAASYAGETGADFDELIDAIATVAASNDGDAIRDLYASADLAVPPEMIV